MKNIYREMHHSSESAGTAIDKLASEPFSKFKLNSSKRWFDNNNANDQIDASSILKKQSKKAQKHRDDMLKENEDLGRKIIDKLAKAADTEAKVLSVTVKAISTWIVFRFDKFVMFPSGVIEDMLSLHRNSDGSFTLTIG